MSGNSPDELEATLSEIRRLNAAFLPWQIRIGPVRLARRVWSMHFFFTFTLFHIGAGVVGGVFIFMREPFRSLGIAIVVGALFAFGSFLTQVWAQSVEKEYKLLELNGGKEIERRLAEAHARYLDLLRRDLPPAPSRTRCSRFNRSWATANRPRRRRAPRKRSRHRPKPADRTSSRQRPTDHPRRAAPTGDPARGGWACGGRARSTSSPPRA
ncbi:hypothetical protein Psuf_093350 [Phytohabitans suffuscus]|uniref:Uncharacterized protein n=1 Tax=Phytohabitans suffuscus TaxID=624315 RepID=A0A6F8Z0Z4_9ACTN|nr:hypothetical protein Psuf_093350 [Phytohabitans suffuscus]